MKKRYSLSVMLSVMFVAMTLTFCATIVLSTNIFEKKVESVSAKRAMYDKISDIESVVRQHYYTDIDDEKVIESLSRGFLEGLGDSETEYLSVADVIEYQEIQSGKIIGIGIDFIKSRENNGYMLVYNVAPDSPADIQGIKAGNTISAIGGVSTVNMSYETAVEMLSGKSGDAVTLTYISEGKETEATLTHKSYDASTVIQKKLDNFGYIKISAFAQGTVSDLDYAINNLTGQDISVLIVDLRDNASKEFEIAAKCADLILKEGTSMYAVYKGGDRKVLYTSDKNMLNIPVVVITNGDTGYAAEMFAVMMRDSHGAKIVGTTTMGKGTLQNMYRLSDGSGIILTVATLSPMSSDSYNGVGIMPDYEKTLDSVSAEALYQMSTEEDPQVVRAMEVAGYLAGVSRSANGDSSSSEDTERSSEETGESSPRDNSDSESE